MASRDYWLSPVSRSRWLAVLAMGVVLFLGATPVGATTFSKAREGSWFDPLNWSPIGVPGVDDSAFIEADTGIVGGVAAIRVLHINNQVSVGSDGGLAAQGTTFIGSTLDSGGVLIVDGDNVFVTFVRDVRIGSAGSGAIEVNNGTVAAEVLFVGGGPYTNEVGQELQQLRQDNPNFVEPTTLGTLTIAGPSAIVSAFSPLESFHVIVGNEANLFGPRPSLESGGSVTVSDGGKLSGNGLVRRSSSATVTGDGSVWNATSLRIDAGGTINVSNGGRLEGNGLSSLTIREDNAGNTGSLLVDGVGSSATRYESLFMGGGIIGAGGDLRITRGGLVHVGQVSLGSTSDVAVQGVASRLRVDTKLDLSGDSGSAGALTISDGGAVMARDLDVGTLTGTHNFGPILDISGEGSTLLVTGATQIGRSNVGTLRVRNGGLARTNTTAIGQGVVAGGTGIGRALIDGAGSKWIVTGALSVGTRGRGALTVANSGVLEAQGVTLGGAAVPGQSPVPAGAINIGAAVGGGPQRAGVLNIATNITIAPTGLIVFNHTDSDYSFATRVESVVFGAGTIEQRFGTTILAIDLDRFTGATHVIGGTLIVNGVLASPLVEVESGATLAGSGTVNNVLAHDGAIIAPGNSPGVLNITGDLTLEPGATLRLEVAGIRPGVDYDVVDVAGDVTLQGALIELAFQGGFAPSAGQRFDFLNVGGSFSGNPNVRVNGLLDGWLYDLSFDASHRTFALTSLSNGVSTLARVSAPTSLPLLCGALLLLGLRRRVRIMHGEA